MRLSVTSQNRVGRAIRASRKAAAGLGTAPPSRFSAVGVHEQAARGVREPSHVRSIGLRSGRIGSRASQRCGRAGSRGTCKGAGHGDDHPPRPALTGASLTVADVAQVARAGRHVELDPAAVERMRASRAVIERLVAEGHTVYGVTTGFGDLADVRIEPEQTAELQRNLVRSHAAGVGEPLPAEVVRAMLLLRANALAVGLSGVRPEVVELLVGMLNAPVHPVVPSRGSVGASGDLAPLAHLALVVIGEGEAWVDEAGPGSGAEALERAGLRAARPGGQGGPGPAERDAADGRARRPGAGRRAATGGLRGRDRRHEPGGHAGHGLRLRRRR